jgi:hypothetical protein
MPTYIVTNSVSTVIFTSTIIVPCHKCLELSQMITLPPAITASGIYQSPSRQSSDVNEIIGTEMLVQPVQRVALYCPC